MALAVALAFVFGYSLTSLPLLRAGMALSAVVPIALASDTISIGVMEVVDNAIMLAVPGAMEAGLDNELFWGSLSVALVVAGAVAVPGEPLAAHAREGPRGGHGQRPPPRGLPDATDCRRGGRCVRVRLGRAHRRGSLTAFPRLRRPVRRLATALALGACVIAGCGGSEASSPLDEALGYLPATAPFAVAIETDLNGGQYGSLNQLIGRFPFSGQIKQQLQRSIEGSGRVNFERDLRPILGNPFVVGGPSTRSLQGQSNEFVGAIQAKDKGKLDELIKRQKATEQGEKNGAKLYRASGGDTFAVKEDVLIVAGTRALLDRALAQREADDRLTEETSTRP